MKYLIRKSKNTISSRVGKAMPNRATSYQVQQIAAEEITCLLGSCRICVSILAYQKPGNVYISVGK